MDGKLITFIVPAFNAEKTLTRTIDSILKQTSNKYKVIIIDDGSKDRTGEIGAAYSQNYPEIITYVYQDNKGLGGARNQGMRLADTPYISFLDSDDWIMPRYVETVALQLEVHNFDKPEIVMILPLIYNENSKQILDWYDKRLFEELFPEDGVCINPQEETKIYCSEVSQCRKILQLEFVRKIDFQFREQVKWEDVYPHFYLLSNCKCCMGIGSVGFYYRKGSGQQITASRGRERMDLLIVFDDLLNYIKSIERKTYIQGIRYSAMRAIVSFANEGIRMADMDTRKALVKALYQYFKKIPKNYDRLLLKEGKKRCGKSELRQYRIFLTVIRRRFFLPVFYDYIYRDASEKMVKKILGKIK